VSPKPPRIGQELKDWISARKRHRLSEAQVQMARELGMNPRTLGKLDNADQEP
jgi:DNA-binding XRE family transcriptional regulator